MTKKQLSKKEEGSCTIISNILLKKPADIHKDWEITSIMSIE